MLVAVCYKTELGPTIGFYEVNSEEAAGKYIESVSARADYVTHSICPIKP